MLLACHAHSNHVVWRTGWEFTTSARPRRFVCCASGTKGTVTTAIRQLVEQLVPLFSILIRRCSCKAHLVLPRKVSFDLLIFTLIDYLRFKSISRERVRRKKRAAGLFSPGLCLRNAVKRPSAALAMATVLKCAKTEEISVQVLSAWVRRGGSDIL